MNDTNHKAELNAAASDGVFVLPASLGQERFWELDRLNPGNPAWNVPVRFRLQGALNTDRIERAFNEIVRRHEVLRTTFGIVEGSFVQIVKPSLEIRVGVIDLRSLAQAERDAAVDRLSMEESRRRFNLATGPLIRVGLLQVADQQHILLVTLHHTVGDYLSIGLISNELGALYDAYTRGVEPILPELAIQYGDFAIWQREQLDSPARKAELAYWTRQLKDLPLLDVPTDRPRPVDPTFDATITSILLPFELTEAMRAIANQAGATFFNAMLAALGIVLQKYSGQTDFGVATQVGGRNNVELESLIGLFINTVVLRMDLSGDPTFHELLSRVQETGTQALTHQDARLEQVLRELRPAEYPSTHSMFRLNFICQRDPVKPLEFSGIELTVIPSKSQGALYDLHVFLVQRAEGWRLACEYNTDLYELATITDLLGDYRKVLESITGNPNRPVSQIEISRNTPAPSLPGEKQIVTSVATEGAVPETTEDAYALPASAAQRRFWVLEEFAPGNPALHMRACVRLTGPVSVETLRQSLQVLVQRHETLRTTFNRSQEEIVQIIAPSRIIPLPVTSLEDVSGPQLEERLHEALRIEASASFDLVQGPLVRARLFRISAEEHVLIITTHHILVDGWSQNVIQRDLWSVYEALEGGRQPVLPLLSIQYADFVQWQQQWLASSAASEQIDFWKKQLAPPLHILDLPTDRVVPQGSSRRAPMETVLLPEDLTASLKKLSQSHDATMFMVMLTAYAVLLHQYTAQEDIVIGSPVANRRPETEPLIGPFAGPVALRVNLAGDPPLLEILRRVRDLTVDALSHADVPFEILVDKLNVRSILGRNPLSQCYFFYQAAFLQPREVRGLTVTPLPDFGLGTHFELQMGLLERREGVRAQLEYNPDLFEAATIQQILNSYKRILEELVACPERRLAELPRPVPRAKSQADSRAVTTPSGKRRKTDETSRRLTQIWEEVLGTHPIGPDQDYFDLGGHSLLAVRLFAQIESAFHVRLPLATLVQAPTIEALAEILRNGEGAKGWSPLVTIQRRGSRPPFYCVHGGGGNVLIYRGLSHHLGSDQPFYGLQCQGLDGKQPLLTRLEDMAALYVNEVQKFQPQGPYFLGGYCLGGLVALEMAQQLKARGEECAMVAMFDTVNLSTLNRATFWDKSQYYTERLFFHFNNFFLLNFKDKLRFFAEKLEILRHRGRVWQGALLNLFATRKDQGAMKSEASLLAQIWETNDQAAMDYCPRPYDGVITDFRPLRQYSRYRDPGIHWDRIALRGQDVVTLPVYPAGMLLEPFVSVLAARLEGSIDKALKAVQDTQHDGSSRLNAAGIPRTEGDISGGFPPIDREIAQNGNGNFQPLREHLGKTT